MSLITPFSIYNNINFSTYFLNVSGEPCDIIFNSPNNFIVVGNITNVNSQSVSSIAFLDNNYRLDNSFLSVSAISAFNYPLREIKQKSNGDFITMRSYYNSETTNNIYNINTQTKKISSMTNPIFNYTQNRGPAIEIGVDDKLIVGGEFTAVNNTTRNCLVCLSGTGTTLQVDNTFRGGVRISSLVQGYVEKIKTDYTFPGSTPGETIIVAGTFNQVNSTNSTTWANRVGIIRLNKSTGLFSGYTFDASLPVDTTIYDFDINDIHISDLFYGNILFTTEFGIYVKNSNGSNNSSFIHNIPGTFWGLKCIYLRTGTNSKKIIVFVYGVGGTDTYRLYRLSSTGTIDTTFNSPKGYVQVYGTIPSFDPGMIQMLYENPNNGNIIIGGRINRVEDKFRNGIVVIDSNGNVI